MSEKIKIEFLACSYKPPLYIDAPDIKEAVEEAHRMGHDLSYAYLPGACLRHADLSGVDFSFADLSRTDMTWVNLSHAKLRETVLRGASLSNSNLSGADLTYADLQRTDLFCVNAQDAVFEGACMRHANLGLSSMRKVNLDDAQIIHVDLRGSVMDGATYDGKELWRVRPILQLGSCGFYNRATIVLFYEDCSEPTVLCGCFRGTISQFEDAIHSKHSGTFYEYEYMAMVYHIKAIRHYQLDHEDEYNNRKD